MDLANMLEMKQRMEPEDELKLKKPEEMRISEKEEEQPENQPHGLDRLLDFKKTWEELSFFDKLKFFDFWFVVSIVGNFIQIIGCVLTILDQALEIELGIFLVKEAIIGFGSMFSWLIMLK